MIELGIITLLVGFMAWREYNYRKENAKLINALISKNAQEARDLEIADKTKIEFNTEPDIPDLVPTDQLNDEDWYKSEIKKEKVKWPIS